MWISGALEPGRSVAANGLVACAREVPQTLRAQGPESIGRRLSTDLSTTVEKILPTFLWPLRSVCVNSRTAARTLPNRRPHPALGGDSGEPPPRGAQTIAEPRWKRLLTIADRTGAPGALAIPSGGGLGRERPAKARADDSDTESVVHAMSTRGRAWVVRAHRSYGLDRSDHRRRPAAPGSPRAPGR